MTDIDKPQMARTLVIIASLLILGLESGAAALAQNDAYAHFQYGGKTCGQFIQSVEEYRKFGKSRTDPDGVLTPVYTGYMSYLWGFLAGANYFDRAHDSVGVRSEVHANSLFLENFCRAHPLEAFQIALEYLRAELIKKGL
jgi:hypothetical protein